MILQKRKINTVLLILSIAILVALSMYIVYFLVRTPSETAKIVDETSKTTSTALTADENFSGGNERSVETSNSDKGQAIVSDDKGNVEAVPNKSDWTTSQTGQITIYSPIKNQFVLNGNKVTGESSLDRVSFRIIDNISGVISDGQLSVVNGKFAGSINFSTSASEGRLDIFGLKDDGIEFSNVEIPLRFK